MTKACIVVVHPTFLLTEGFLYEQIKKLGHLVLSIQTSVENLRIDEAKIKTSSDFYLRLGDAPEKDAPQLQSYLNNNSLNPILFINGIDSTIYYTDYLQKYFLNYPISLTASKRRLNKFQVVQALKKARIKAIPSIEVTSVEEAKEKINQINQLNWPIIAKPSENTAGMSNVQLVCEPEDLYDYLRENINKKHTSYSEKIIKKIILQTYLDSNEYTEFAIDFVSYNGQHYLAGVVEYQTVNFNGTPLRRYNYLHTPDDLTGIEILLNYTKDVLDALGVAYGFTHNELLWNEKTQQCFLIESNNRMAGNGNMELYKYCYGISPLEIMLQAIKGERIKMIFSQHKRHAKIMSVYNFSTAISNSIYLKNIQSVNRIIHFRNKIRLPQDFYKYYSRAEHIGAGLLLCNDNKEVLENDINEILIREKAGILFE